ncbi:MAG: VCBS repeat-containing protein [Candidatus Korarchaeum sp.]
MRYSSLLTILLALQVALPLSVALGSPSEGYAGLGALRNGGKLLLFKQSLPGDPVALISLNGGKTLLVVSSDGTITYMDSNSALRTLSVCAGRQVRIAHASTRSGGAAYAICYSRERGVASFVTIMDSGGFKFFGLAEVSRRDSSGGFVYSEYRTDFPTVTEPPTPLVADVDGDGYDEALVYLDKQLLYVDSPFGEPEAYSIYETPLGFAFGDLDGDGRKEVVMASHSGILLWRRGELRTYSSQACSSAPLLADFDGDGKLEVACYRGDTLQVIKGNSLLLRAEGGVTEPVAADLNGDGRPELIYAMRDGTLVARSIGGVLWRAKVEAPYNRVAVADVDGDLKPEVVAACGQYLYCFSHEGKEKWRLSLREPSGWVSGGSSTFQTYVRFEAKTPPVLLDFDKDGLLEVILGIGAYLEQGRVALVDEVAGAGEPPRVEVLQPSNYTKVGRYFNLSFRVMDDLSSVLKAKVSVYSNGWVEIWSGEVKSGDTVRKELPSSESVMIEASDGLLTSKAILKLRVDTEPPKMLIEPRNMSKIGPGTNITVRIVAPIEEYAFLTVLHGTGGQWSRILERRVWKTSLVSIDVTPIVKLVSGYHCFKFVLKDRYGNTEEVMMRYSVSKSAEINPSKEGKLSLRVPSGAVSGVAKISWSLENVDRASLYYGSGAEWNLIREVEGNGSIEWDVSSLPDGDYSLKLESGELRALTHLRVDNTPPEIEVRVDREVLRVGDVATVRVSGEFDRLYWDLDGDGRFETLGPPEARIEAREPGVIRLGVMAVDEANNTVKREISLKVEERLEVQREVEVNETDPGPSGPLDLGALVRPELVLPVTGILAAAILKSGRRGGRKRRSNPWR